MSQENVEVVRKLYELFGRRDVAAAFPDYADPNLELRVPPLYPDTPAVFRRQEGVERWIRMIDEVWAEWRFEPKRYLDAGSTVVVLARLIAEGGCSGIHLEREVAHLWVLEKRRAVSIRVYLDQPKLSKPPGLGGRRCPRTGITRTSTLRSKMCGASSAAPSRYPEMVRRALRWRDRRARDPRQSRRLAGCHFDCHPPMR